MQFKQDGFYFPNRFYLQKGQGSSNEFLKNIQTILSHHHVCFITTF